VSKPRRLALPFGQIYLLVDFEADWTVGVEFRADFIKQREIGAILVTFSRAPCL
jgi:hypothetical protein